ncbi:MAG: ShlB/FhaC/HecB family hemolysin secretion/activation protein [Leptolyngbyaceae cyanobacterium RU_5_1]|nr:ShlB/FhaC/HecB family hemolysin secretion/activation protein [Leptolyngbyaceae cyanobacterium RU_5_1]
MPSFSVDHRNSRWRRSLQSLLQSSPIVLAGSFVTGHASAMPPDASPPDLQPESLPAEAVRDRQSHSSPSLSPAPTLPETLPNIEMARSLPQAEPQLTPLPAPAPPEAISGVEKVRSLPQPETISSNKFPSSNTEKANSLGEQSIDIVQVPTGRDLDPQSPRDENLNPSSPTRPPETRIQGTTSEEFACPEPPAGSPEGTSGTVKVKQFKFVEVVNGKLKVVTNSVFTEKDLNSFTKGYLDKPLLPSELIAAACEVTKQYIKLGYKTSGAIVQIPIATQEGKEKWVGIQVIEGELKRENIYIQALPDPPKDQNPTPELPAEQPKLRLNPEYIRKRLIQGLSNKPLNVDKLQENLRLLQLDPLIKTITARLSEVGNTKESRLDIGIKENPLWSAQLGLDNYRSPSIGSLQRQVALERANLLGGIGDRLEVGYGNTDGSNRWDASYTVPWNALNGTVKFTYSGGRNRVVEFPFDDIDGDGDRSDIESNSSSYELTLRQPVIRHVITRKLPGETSSVSTFHEFALGLTASLRDSQTFLLDLPFPLSPGADDNGFTRTVALRFFQEYTRQKNNQEVLAFRSQFNLGLNALGSTLNEPVPGTNEAVPDSRFFSWQGQAQWVRQILGSSLLVTRANVQLADRPLLSGEQFAIGGAGSVRGYRQDTLQTDNGLFASMELRVPIRRFDREEGLLQVIPFLDYGTGWNNDGRANPKPNSLLSAGLGVQLQFGHVDNGWGQLRARLDWGVPLTAIASRGKTWQENGLTFSLQWQRQFQL